MAIARVSFFKNKQTPKGNKLLFFNFLCFSSFFSLLSLQINQKPRKTDHFMVKILQNVELCTRFINIMI